MVMAKEPSEIVGCKVESKVVSTVVSSVKMLFINLWKATNIKIFQFLSETIKSMLQHGKFNFYQKI
jgi:hypothetical protein